MTRRRRARSDAILDAAEALLLEGGDGALTMRALAQRVEMTPGAVYRYFGGRMEIIAALGQRTLGRCGSALAEAETLARSAGGGLPPEDAQLLVLATSVRRYLMLMSDGYASFRLFNLLLVDFRAFFTSPDSHARFMAGFRALLQHTAGHIDASVAAGALRPGAAMDRALGLFSALNGALMLVKTARGDPDLIDVEAIAGGLVRGLLRGWGADERAASEAWTRAGEVLAAG